MACVGFLLSAAAGSRARICFPFEWAKPLVMRAEGDAHDQEGGRILQVGEPGYACKLKPPCLGRWLTQIPKLSCTCDSFEMGGLQISCRDGVTSATGDSKSVTRWCAQPIEKSILQFAERDSPTWGCLRGFIQFSGCSKMVVRSYYSPQAKQTPTRCAASSLMFVYTIITNRGMCRQQVKSEMQRDFPYS